LPPRSGRHIVISVRDTGVGMDAATQARIFEPFFTTKGPAEGTGLGLAMVYGIVQQSGGEVLVLSAPGHGSTFSVYLPRVEDAPAAPSPGPAGASARGSETIMVVEDEDAVRRLTTTALRRGGYDVLEAASGPEALIAHARHPDRIALLVTDVVMPKMSGLELAARLSALQPDLKVLCVSSYSAEQVEAKGPGAWPFMGKPFVLAELLVKVREVLDSNSRLKTKTKNPPSRVRSRARSCASASRAGKLASARTLPLPRRLVRTVNGPCTRGYTATGSSHAGDRADGRRRGSSLRPTSGFALTRHAQKSAPDRGRDRSPPTLDSTTD
jgi:CheY-like chemotaxis protein